MLSADDAELVRRLTGVDQVQPIDAMRENWPPPPASSAPARRGGRLVIYTPFAPAENYAVSRGEAVERRQGTGGRLLGPASVGRDELRAPAADAAGRRSAGPDARARRTAKREEPARDRPDPACLANRGARPGRGHEGDRARRLRVPPGRGGAVCVSGQRRAPGRLPVDHGGRHGQHPQHALLPEHGRAEGRRPGADGLRAGLSLLHERHRPHVAGQRHVHARTASAARASSWSIETRSSRASSLA